MDVQHAWQVGKPGRFYRCNRCPEVWLVGEPAPTDACSGRPQPKRTNENVPHQRADQDAACPQRPGTNQPTEECVS